MPTRKQRRRRAKGQRHEYEWILEDEEGHEVEVDPSDLRREKEAGRGGGARSASRGGKPAPGKDRRGRPIRPAKPPSWRRAATRAVIFAVALFVLTSFTQRSQVLTRVAIAVAYGVFGIPFFYFLDRTTYRRYLKVVGRQDELSRRR